MPAVVRHFGQREVTQIWRWRDREGKFHTPKSMSTRHLFHTFRMIWNNFMPTEWWVGDVKLYDFPPFYTKAYFADAIVFIGRELFRRPDIKPEWREQLCLMELRFVQHQERLE
ncbi:hypothetical protein CPT_Seuss95 [Caulobacter phage Seuss]|uniref:Uncharacterized protein n=1 Tax=Caulobacter phage Seuss TaxID=1675601 RepID=A0A0K1LM90_9CAUD|nr:hypothetical protein HOR08_gp095 [Caulobacter phage Seuss]AKU43621.1 hypothetical protein CPT_Seuss95 [Caulobacter phage Seuss]